MRLFGKLFRQSLYAYDGNGNRLAITNALNNTVQFGYNGSDRLTSITNALLNVWRFAYDPEGRRTNSVDPNLHTNTWVYDPVGQLRAATNALGFALQFQYDLAGNR